MTTPAAPRTISACLYEEISSGAQQAGEPGLRFNQRLRAQIFAVDVHKIEQEEDERSGIAAIGCRLDHAERGDAVGAHAAELAVEIGAERRYGRGDRWIFVGPVSPVRVSNRTAPSSRRACMRKPSNLISWSQSGPSGAASDELRELRLDPLRQTGDGPPC
jgi:hypothetical protein